MKYGWQFLGLLLLCCETFCGCKPREIHGQMFIATQGRENVKLGAVKVMLIERADAIAALQTSKAAIEKRLSELDQMAAQQSSEIASIDWVSYMTNSDYLAVSIEKSNALERIKKLNQEAGKLYFTNDELRVKAYSSVRVSEDMYRLELLLLLTKANTLFRNGSVLFIKSDPPAGEPQAIRTWRAFLDSVEKDYPPLKAQVDVLQSFVTNCDVQFADMKQSLHSKNKVRGEQARKKLEQVRQAITLLKSGPDSYFARFSPKAVQSTVTDADGNFSLSLPRFGSYVLYAKAERMVPSGNSEKYYWLLGLSEKSASTRIILANNNLFEVDAEWADLRPSH